MSTAVEQSSFTKPQKAAILIMYLEREVSKKILAQLSDDEVRTIGMAMASIDKVTPLEIESVVAEFLRDLVDTTLVKYNGPGYVKQILPDLIDEERRDQIIPPLCMIIGTCVMCHLAANFLRWVTRVLLTHPRRRTKLIRRTPRLNAQ